MANGFVAQCFSGSTCIDDATGAKSSNAWATRLNRNRAAGHTVDVLAEGRALGAVEELVRGVATVLRAAAIERERPHGALPEPDVDEVRLDLPHAAGHFEREVFEDGARSVEQHRRAEQRHVEAERVEQAGERAVELEAPSAATGIDDLGHRGIAIVRHPLTEHDVEILERHGGEMGVLEQREPVEVGADQVRLEAESVEVSIDVDAHGQPVEWSDVVSTNGMRAG